GDDPPRRRLAPDRGGGRGSQPQAPRRRAGGRDRGPDGAAPRPGLRRGAGLPAEPARPRRGLRGRPRGPAHGRVRRTARRGRAREVTQAGRLDDQALATLLQSLAPPPSTPNLALTPPPSH